MGAVPIFAKKILEENKHVLFAYLFGSVARGEQSPLSDIDIAVYFHQDIDLTTEKLNLMGDLIDQMGTDHIDLVILNTAPLSLAARILKCREILVDRHPFIRHLYESLIMRESFDFYTLETSILKRRYAHGG
jgi:hypothetical protein